jgi:hypothetical protein
MFVEFLVVLEAMTKAGIDFFYAGPECGNGYNDER